MKITLIKPNIGRMEHSLYVDEGRMEPLQVGILAGLTPDDVDVALYDDRMETIPYDEPTDLVAITVETFTARRAYEISGEFRSRGIPVIMGGVHPTLLPEEVQYYADAIFLGDAETLWQQVIDDVRAGQLKSVYRAPVGVAQSCNIIPRRKLFEGKGYLPITLLQFSRGCPHSCNFCAISSYFNKKHYVREIDQVLEEISGQGRKFLFFVDDNIVANRAAAKDLFRELAPLKLRWVSQASIDMTHDHELMDLMACSGCLGHVIGFESLNQESLKSMGKGLNLNDFSGYLPQLEILRDFGLQTWAAFTLGHEYDTTDSISRTLDFALEHKFAFAAFNILMPYPKTILYSELKQQGRLLYDEKWWLHPEYRFNHAAFVPKNMTADELTEICFEIRKNFNSFPSIIRRIFDLKTNLRTARRLGIFLRYNPLFRKETFKKQGMFLGLTK
ncbi:MAG: B12-binding domain-containing radical SAM protein [Desulfobulbaceae bacterium]|nr:B12-binding domain-containing radical SAM protein [Desulfobulbaceae bacterium]